MSFIVKLIQYWPTSKVHLTFPCSTLAWILLWLYPPPVALLKEHICIPVSFSWNKRQYPLLLLLMKENIPIPCALTLKWAINKRNFILTIRIIKSWVHWKSKCAHSGPVHLLQSVVVHLLAQYSVQKAGSLIIAPALWTIHIRWFKQWHEKSTVHSAKLHYHMLHS